MVSRATAPYSLKLARANYDKSHVADKEHERWGWLANMKREIAAVVRRIGLWSTGSGICRADHLLSLHGGNRPAQAMVVARVL